MMMRQRLVHTLYLYATVALGFVALFVSLLRVHSTPGGIDWLILAALTLLTGRFTIQIPAVNSKISISDTFVFTNMVLFGIPAGVITAALDGLMGSMRSGDGGKRMQFALFNICSTSLWTYVSGSVFYFLINRAPLFQNTPPGLKEILLPLASMALVHFFLNSGGVALIVALDAQKSVYRVWHDSFLWTSISCFTGAFATGLIALNVTSVTPAVICVLTLIVILIYRTYKTYLDRVQESIARLKELNKLYLSTVETLAMAIDAKDQVIHGHVRRVQVYARTLAQAMGITDENTLRGIEAAGLLHDIGKLAIPEYILNKPGDLTATEFQKMMIHPVVGADILASINFPYPVAEFVRHHHEHWDGTGYPDRLKGTQIPLGARILSVADAYEALTCDRPYRAGYSRDQALHILRSRAGKQYDPGAVEALHQVVGRLIKEVRELDARELNVEGLRVIADSARKQERLVPRRSRDLLVFQNIASTNREVFALYELAQTLGSSLNLRETLLIIASKIEKIVPFTTCVIYLCSPSKDNLKAEHALGADAEAFKGYSMCFGENLSGRVAACLEPAINEDPAYDLVPLKDKLTTNLTNALVYPLTIDERCLGTISLYAERGAYFKDDHVRVMEIVSRQAATAISNAVKFEETQEDAFTDRLTSLPNSRYLYLYFEQEIQKAIRHQYPLTILEMDLDGLKTINDSYGHPAGDRMLHEVAKLLKTNLRGSDVVIRYAGDEFVAIMAQTPPKDAALLAKRVQAAVDDYRLEVRPGKHVQAGISIGLASYPDDGDSLDALMTRADEDMYRDKDSRRKSSRHILHSVDQPPRQLELKNSVNE